ncbi:MAG: EF-hand domain-containing protein [Armatimonadetes bacterium]|nr:EF-hand domain-containing protein [Armatimonadota bacterium]
MLSELQKRKFTLQFKLFDVDQNHLIEAADFERMAQGLASTCGLTAPEQGDLLSRCREFWVAIRDACDTDRDGSITLEEWLDYHRSVLEQDRLRREAGRGYSSPFEVVTRFVFDLLDEDGDGRLTAEEYRKFCLVQGIDEVTADLSFRQLDRAGEGHLLREEVVDMVLEFYFCDDPGVAGNWLFGPIPLSV